MNRLAITIAVLIVALCTPAFSSYSDATRINNGAKLLLKEGSDSLFCSYDNDGMVEYSYSVGGESWSSPASVASGQDYPAIAADSTGRRWIIAHEPPDVMGYEHQYLYTGAGWSSMTQLYESQDAIGPASIAGGTSTVAHFIYAAFLVTDTAANPDAYYVVLTKHKLGDQSTVAACTLNIAYAPYEHLGDPAVAVEPYDPDYNRVYVAWEREGLIYCSYCLDGRGSGISSSWTSNVPLSDTNYVSRHPCIGADRDRVVIAWAQGSPPDIYARERLSGTWGNAADLSNSVSDSSDYPTIALGDKAVVAWEEAVSVNDHDIYACIDFDDDGILNIADNATVSSYPHVVLHPDGEDLYLHTFWSEPNWAVGRDKLELN